MKVNGFAAVVFLVVILAASIALSGWLVMLAAGILFNAGVIPASLGFGDSIWLGLIIAMFTAGSAAGSSK